MHLRKSPHFWLEGETHRLLNNKDTPGERHDCSLKRKFKFLHNASIGRASLHESQYAHAASSLLNVRLAVAFMGANEDSLLFGSLVG